MKYTCEIVVGIAREELVKKLYDPENMKHWQRGLLGYEPISGSPGEEGSRTRLDYVMGKREMTMVETVIKKALPEEFHATYDAKGVHNLQKNFFQEIHPNTTKWISQSEFHFSSMGLKLMSWLMPGAFKKQSRKYMEDFKNFAEKGTSVLDS